MGHALPADGRKALRKQEYKTNAGSIVNADDLIVSAAITGTPASWLKPSPRRRAGRDPDNLGGPAARDYSGGQFQKRWRDIWAAGPGASGVRRRIETVAEGRCRSGARVPGRDRTLQGDHGMSPLSRDPVGRRGAMGKTCLKSHHRSSWRRSRRGSTSTAPTRSGKDAGDIARPRDGPNIVATNDVRRKFWRRKRMSSFHAGPPCATPMAAMTTRSFVCSSPARMSSASTAIRSRSTGKAKRLARFRGCVRQGRRQSDECRPQPRASLPSNWR
jgi:hypothetical protein